MSIILLQHANDCLAAIAATSDFDPALCNCKPRDGKPDDPVGMLQEIEAYLCFRLMSEKPTVPEADMRGIKHDIALLLRRNGVKGYE